MFEQQDFSFIYKYFSAEKQESLLFLTIGIIAVTLSVVFFFFIKTNPSFFKGAAVPLLVIGIVQIVVGYTIYARSDRQGAEIAYKMGMEPAAFVKTEELPRMETVNKNFVIYRWVEIALVVAGVVLILLFKTNPGKPFWYGVGMTLTIQAVLMLGADYFAEKRAKDYTEKIQTFIKPG